MTVTIRTRYLTGDRWDSNVGGIRATGAGRQATVRWESALGREDNHRRAAVMLADRLADAGTVPGVMRAGTVPGVSPGDILTPLRGTATDDPGRYLWTLLEPWPGDRARELAGNARYVLADHGHRPSDRDPLTRENCGACVLAGYGATADGPGYGAWARVYVKAGRAIPAAWAGALRRELAGSDPFNAAYADALRRDVLTFGATVGGAA